MAARSTDGDICASARRTHRLLPARLQGRVRVTLALSSGLLVVLTASVADAGHPALDRLAALAVVPSSPLLQELLDLAARALPRAMPLGVTALAALCWSVGARRAALLSLLGPTCAYVATSLLKVLLERPSGSGDGWMFPSGHVTVVAAVATVLTILLLRDGLLAGRLPRRWLPIARTATVLATAGTAFATVAHRHHYASDVVGGILTALIMVLVVAALIDRVPPPMPQL